jgi:hypothetical protein
VQAQAARGRMVSLRSLLGRAAELDPQLGWSVERLGLTAVRELRAHGHRFDLWLAIRQLRSALDASSEPEQASDAIALALGYYEAGDWSRARALVDAWEPRASGTEAFRLAAIGALADVRLGHGDGAATAARLEADATSYRFGEPHFWAMRNHALAGRPDAAVAALRSARARGFPWTIELHREQDLASLAGYAPFEELQRGID